MLPDRQLQGGEIGADYVSSVSRAVERIRPNGPSRAFQDRPEG